ncbi:hypothetical protein [Murimonas intestini]|uniref:Uncharacterized protein n=1 Tax=Murimonas intestini TaxID=1337051 RepID=A0AB73T250_9FIRM|nr:hypothetical protein [Murimonas intestini]MCR1842519.1 hypothetical protein [Murimonas intestini]MCR1867123.1 hypothetical protein [Murimonas intestini]MCR1884309.1 hypothetical protein [Murimonas intestini]
MDFGKFLMCKHCGFISDGPADGKCHKCHFCGYPLEECETQYTQEEWINMEFDERSRVKESIAENVIKNAPEFSEDAMLHRQIQSEKEMAEFIDQAVNRIKNAQPNQVKCPYCGSGSVQKISLVKRVLWSGIFGIASPTIGKEWHCNQCNSDF